MSQPIDPTSSFHKKVFSKLDSSPIKHISPKPKDSTAVSPKKIVPTLATGGLREKFKETFIPLFIEVFELRQMVENCKAEEYSPSSFLSGKTTKTPEEILKQLEDLQNHIEESRRWHEGMILQIERGIAEATEALSLLKKTEAVSKAQKKSLKKRFFSFIKKPFQRK